MATGNDSTYTQPAAATGHDHYSNYYYGNWAQTGTDASQAAADTTQAWATYAGYDASAYHGYAQQPVAATTADATAQAWADYYNQQRPSTPPPGTQEDYYSQFKSGDTTAATTSGAAGDAASAAAATTSAAAAAAAAAAYHSYAAAGYGYATNQVNYTGYGGPYDPSSAAAYNAAVYAGYGQQQAAATDPAAAAAAAAYYGSYSQAAAADPNAYAAWYAQYGVPYESYGAGGTEAAAAGAVAAGVVGAAAPQAGGGEAAAASAWSYASSEQANGVQAAHAHTGGNEGQQGAGQYGSMQEAAAQQPPLPAAGPSVETSGRHPPPPLPEPDSHHPPPGSAGGLLATPPPPASHAPSSSSAHPPLPPPQEPPKSYAAAVSGATAAAPAPSAAAPASAAAGGGGGFLQGGGGGGGGGGEDRRRLQISANPRLAGAAPGQGQGQGAQVRPAYVQVGGAHQYQQHQQHHHQQQQQQQQQGRSQGGSADSAIQPTWPVLVLLPSLLELPGQIPPSLRGYVERALGRCKGEAQKAVCQQTLKKMIMQASKDGSLFKKDWDTEPLFPLPDSGPATENASVAPMMRRKPKSRWEVEEAQPSRPLASGGAAGGTGSQPALLPPPPALNEAVRNQIKERLAALRPSPAAPSAFKGAMKRGRGGQRRDEESSSSGESEGEAAQERKERMNKALQQGRVLETPEERHRRQKRSKRFELGEGGSGREAGGPGNGNGNHNSRRGGAANGGGGRGGRGGGGGGRGGHGGGGGGGGGRGGGGGGGRGGGGGGSDVASPLNLGSGGSASARKAHALHLAMSAGAGDGRAVEDIDWDSLTIRGICQQIEKSYLRLTCAPDPSVVRPEDVLKRALAHVEDLMAKGERTYAYALDQLKSIRQDLTVQRIRNEFTVQVYETHARMALEYGDFAEYNQCQTQLKGLYGEGIKGCEHEFAAYRLLYIIFQSNSNSELQAFLASFPPEARADPAVGHALAVCRAVNLGNYFSFFQLYANASSLSRRLMEMHVEKMRFEAVTCMAKSYRPGMSVSSIATLLRFEREDEDTDDEEGDAQACEDWLTAHGATLTGETAALQLDCKASSGNMYIPEVADAVPHGDVKLAMSDFLARPS